MSKFRPCIDLHQGCVKQIVGSTYAEDNRHVTENFSSENPAEFFARKYREDRLRGGHVIKLGPGNDQAARNALAAYPMGLQIGGGIHLDNAKQWLQWGASHVIVTSWLFNEQGTFQFDRANQLAKELGSKRIVIDLSCKQVRPGHWTVAMNRWQTLTDLSIEFKTLDKLLDCCDEFLIHSADVEGKCDGIDFGLIAKLAQWQGCPITYAGGIASIEDIEKIEEESKGHIDFTVGSALDLFGGNQLSYESMVRWNQVRN
ncbi:MAG: phosphoribosylformimino-5-aminoimidazole carboxamide ribotide isomerase [Planctomycetota bacterium]